VLQHSTRPGGLLHQEKESVVLYGAIALYQATGSPPGEDYSAEHD